MIHLAPRKQVRGIRNMVRKTRKSGVQDIIKSLVDSEIPEIQAVAKQLTDWTKQLEEHSWKLQHYASEIESVAAMEASESREDLSLAELVKDLEVTLAQLRGGPGRPPALTEAKKAPVAEKPAAAYDTRAVKPVAKPVVEEEEKEEKATYQGIGKYTTPEGFIVRRARY
jgi:hypothetical protein